MSLRGFVDLQCGKCGGKVFAPISNLVWQEGRGMTARPVGHYCIGCKAQVDAGTMIDAAKKDHLKQQIKELEDQQ